MRDLYRLCDRSVLCSDLCSAVTDSYEISVSIGDHRLAHFLDQDVGDLGLFYNRDVLSVAHTSLQEASIGDP